MMFRDITEEEKKLIAAKGKKCEALGCEKEIEMVEIREFTGGGANLPSYFCSEHAKRQERGD
jgi:hypothetical protein